MARRHKPQAPADSLSCGSAVRLTAAHLLQRLFASQASPCPPVLHARVLMAEISPREAAGAPALLASTTMPVLPPWQGRKAATAKHKGGCGSLYAAAPWLCSDGDICSFPWWPVLWHPGPG